MNFFSRCRAILMNDKELADKVVALGVGERPELSALEDLVYTSVLQHQERFVRDAELEGDGAHIIQVFGVGVLSVAVPRSFVGFPGKLSGFLQLNGKHVHLLSTQSSRVFER